MIMFEKVSYNDKGTIPTRADYGSAGHDFYLVDDLKINPGETALVPTYIKARMNNDVVLLLYVRSSIGIKKHLMLSNGTGVIDASYYNNKDNEGNIMCALYNYGTEPVELKAGERIMQGIFVKFDTARNSQAMSNKRTGGIGSSGN